MTPIGVGLGFSAGADAAASAAVSFPFNSVLVTGGGGFRQMMTPSRHLVVRYSRYSSASLLCLGTHNVGLTLISETGSSCLFAARRASSSFSTVR